MAFATSFAAVGAYAPYLPVFYRSLGLTFEQIGLLAAVASLGALLAAPAWGMLSDRLRSPLVLPAACAGAAASAALLGVSVDPVVVALCAVLFGLWFAGVGPLLDARALDAVADDQFHYSRLRVWGSASFIVSALGVGALIEAAGLRSLFPVLVVFVVATGLIAWRLGSTDATHPVMPRFTGLTAIAHNHRLVSFLAIALLTWSASIAINGFLSIYITQIGAPQTLVGGSWALGAVVEIPLMLAFPQIARRFGLERLIVVGAGFLLLRVVVLLVVSDPMLVAATMALHGAGFALLLVGGVTYVARLAPPGAAATAQGLLSGIIFGLGPALGPLVGGVLAGALGVPQMFVVPAVASAAAVALMARVVRQPAVSSRTAAGSVD